MESILKTGHPQRGTLGVNMVGQREKDATVLVRADATESQIKKLLPTAGLVHLATHGELSEDDPLSSAMAEAQI